ncbi:putative membrane protein [Campylobacter pinnipediorum subsp. pinnipediorum]|nr:putative membrane protein [Campylobacter pinnipediorum subsp. pinnipediorum]
MFKKIYEFLTKSIILPISFAILILVLIRYLSFGIKNNNYNTDIFYLTICNLIKDFSTINFSNLINIAIYFLTIIMLWIAITQIKLARKQEKKQREQKKISSLPVLRNFSTNIFNASNFMVNYKNHGFTSYPLQEVGNIYNDVIKDMLNYFNNINNDYLSVDEKKNIQKSFLKLINELTKSFEYNFDLNLFIEQESINLESDKAKKVLKDICRQVSNQLLHDHSINILFSGQYIFNQLKKLRDELLFVGNSDIYSKINEMVNKFQHMMKEANKNNNLKFFVKFKEFNELSKKEEINKLQNFIANFRLKELEEKEELTDAEKEEINKLQNFIANFRPKELEKICLNLAKKYIKEYNQYCEKNAKLNNLITKESKKNEYFNVYILSMIGFYTYAIVIDYLRSNNEEKISEGYNKITDDYIKEMSRKSIKAIEDIIKEALKIYEYQKK